MSYPSEPETTGDLIVGDLAARIWRRFVPDSDGMVLSLDSIGGTYGLKWTDNLGVKTLESDLTLTDAGPGVETTVFRTNASGQTSIENSSANQTFFLGGVAAASSLMFTQVAGLNTITPASTRGLTFAMDAARLLTVSHGGTASFVFNAGSNQSYRTFRQYDSTATDYGWLGADNSGRLYLGGNHAQKQTYIAGVIGSTSDGLLVRDDGDLWLHSTTNNANMKFNVPSGGAYTWFHNFGTLLNLGSASMVVAVPTTLQIIDAVLNNISYGGTFQHGTTGGVPLAGFGAGATFQLHDSVRAYRTAAAWDVLWEDPTAASPDAAIRFRTITAGTYATNNLLFLSGLYNAVGIDTTTPGARLDVNGSFKARGNVGFNNLGPIAIPTAYTQTYATAARTVTTPTPLATFRAMGEIHIADNVTATTISTTATWTQVQLTFTDGHLDSFDTPSAYELRYTGATTTAFHLGCTVSLSVAGANQTIRAVLVKNATVNGSQEYVSGTILTAGTIRTKTGGSGDNISTAIHVMSSLATNDTLSLFVYNGTSTADITVIDCNLFGMGITQDLADDVAELKQLVNALIDDGQAYGLLQ
jgi:hypothetical protein